MQYQPHPDFSGITNNNPQPTMASPPRPGGPDPEDKVRVSLTGAQETLLITLVAKAFDYHAATPVLGDKHAVDILHRLHDAEGIMHRLRIMRQAQSTIASRALTLDTWLVEFLEAHEGEEVTVLHLACGLDTRPQRLAGMCGRGVRWIDVDFPEVIALREILIPEPDLPGAYEVLTSSVNEEEWFENIPNDRPTVIVMEGLTMYLLPQDRDRLIQRLAEHFPFGQILFDCMSWWTCKISDMRLLVQGGFKARFIGPVDDLGPLEKLHDGLKLRDVVDFWNGAGMERSTWFSWVTCLVARMVGARTRYVRVEF
jgi:O-methyltransferase involved in polyketide biosynthesis